MYAVTRNETRPDGWASLRRRLERLAGVLALGIVLCLAASAGVPAAERDNEPRFTVVTRAENPSIDGSTVVLRYRGAVVPPMAARLEEAIAGLDRPYDMMILDLFSAGGEISHARQVVGVLRELKKNLLLTTLVRQG